MKTLTYKFDDMLRAGQLLNSVAATGTSNFRALAMIADILDSGTPGEIVEKEEKEDAVDKQEIRKD